MCIGESQASVLEVTVEGRGAGEVREAIGEQPRWGIRVSSASGSVCAWHPWSHSIRPSSRGASQLGRTAWHRDAGIWQMPGTSHISGQGLNRLPHQNALGIGYSLEAWRAAWEGRGGGKAPTPGPPACGELQPCGLSPPRLPHPPEVCRVVDADG